MALRRGAPTLIAHAIRASKALSEDPGGTCETPRVAISPLPGSRPPDPAPLNRSLDRIVRHLGGPSADAVTALFADWATIVGSPLDAHTHPLSLTDRCLVVAVDDPAWASQLRFLERELRGQVNDRLGPGAVDAVQFRVRPSTSPEVDGSGGSGDVG